MMPYVYGFSMYFVMWGVAAVVGVTTALTLIQRHNIAVLKSCFAIALVIVSLVVGAKLLFLLEGRVFPTADSQGGVSSTIKLGWTHGFRIPGGMLLATITLPAICWIVRLDVRRFADATVPAMGLTLACFRLGCFLNGCCAGPISDLPWPLAVSFSSTSRVFSWQVRHGLIDRIGRSLPVVPLQLLYVALGIGLFAIGVWMNRREHRPGLVWVVFCAAYFSATLILEPWQLPSKPLNSLVGYLGLLTTGLLYLLTATTAQIERRRVTSHV
jgi:prolipoprotein diacylglyceryltransferase